MIFRESRGRIELIYIIAIDIIQKTHGKSCVFSYYSDDYTYIVR